MLEPLDIKNYRGGHFTRQSGAKPFLPEPVNREWLVSDAETNTLLGEANRKLGELNAFSRYVPNVDVFIMMHVAKEATSSTRIEGTQTNIEEAVLSERDVSPEKRDDWREVKNYTEAMNYAVEELKRVPISTRLLKSIHEIILFGARGERKTPGEYRTSQNWIGGATIRDAVFVPPPYEEVGRLMGDLENFLHNDKINVPHLVKVAIIHAQFETIHPFLDGNGRIGRLLITLYLVSNGLLSKPVLYVSEFLEKNKGLYYDNLSSIRTSNSMGQWLKFFLVAVVETSKKGVETLQKILALKEEIDGKRIVKLGERASKGRALMNTLYRIPVVRADMVAENIGVSLPTAYKLIGDFCKLKILREITGQSRNRVFVFDEYLRLFE